MPLETKSGLLEKPKLQCSENILYNPECIDSWLGLLGCRIEKVLIAGAPYASSIFIPVIGFIRFLAIICVNIRISSRMPEYVTFSHLTRVKLLLCTLSRPCTPRHFITVQSSFMLLLCMLTFIHCI